MEEYYRKLTKQKVFSGKNIFGDAPKLFIGKIGERTFIYDKRERNTVPIWWDGCIGRIPSPYFTKVDALVFTKIGDGIWDVRIPTTEEIDTCYKKQHSQVSNISSNGVDLLLNDYATHLHLGEPHWWLKVICINNAEEGSYIVLNSVYDDENELTSANLKEEGKYNKMKKPRFSFVTKAKKRLYLPKPFREMTGIGSNTSIPVWLRSDGAVIVEGRPGICKKCGCHISRYKTPIGDLCPKCETKKESLQTKRIKELCRQIKNI